MLDADVEDVAILMPDKKSPTYLPFILVGTSVLASTAALGLACASFVAFNERNEHITRILLVATIVVLTISTIFTLFTMSLPFTISREKAQRQALESERDELKKQADELRDKCHQLEAERDKLKQEVDELREKRRQLEAERDEWRSKFYTLQSEMKEQIAQKKVDKVIASIQEELLKPNPQPSPEQIKLVTTIGKKFVSPGCSSPSDIAWWGAKTTGGKDFESGGSCQICRTSVPTFNHGLQCCNRGHWACWSCMVKGIDWKKALQENPELFIEQQKEAINDNLEMDAKGTWRK